MSRFAQQGALEYDSRIGTLIPAYDALHQTSAAYLRARLPEQARILVVGAGTGAEVLALARHNPHWQITAVEPSADMLAVARDKCVAAAVENVDFVEGYTDSLPPTAAFDAVLCLLVLHFLNGTEAKHRLLADMAERTRAGAPLLLCDLIDSQPLLREALLNYAVASGLPADYRQALRERLQREFFPLTETDFAALAASAGWQAPQPYFRALDFAAWILDRDALAAKP